MPYKKRTSDTLPEWLWFFLLLPITLIVALLYKRRRLPPLQPQPEQSTTRYVEPDSIPINMSSTQRSGQGLTGIIPVAEEALSAAEELPVAEELPLVEMTAMDELLLEEQPEPAGAPSDEPVEDDLKIIEGIGPVIAGLLRENGIRTFHQLAKASVQQLADILQRANLSRLADPVSWPEQAQLAKDGKWEGLTALKDTLKGGRRRAR